MSIIKNKIFAKFNKREIPTIYLDIVAVVPRKDIKKKFELFSPKNFDKKLQMILEQLLKYQKLTQEVDIKKENLILDVALSDYRLGSIWTFITWDYFIPIFWRPKIQLRSRLYKYGNKKVIAKFRITKYLPWKYFFNRVFSWSITAAFEGPKDTQVLLNHAVSELQDQINNFIAKRL